MLTKLISTTAVATLLVALTANGAAAQSEQEGQQAADACLIQMNEFGERMNADEFWITGWGTSGYGSPVAPQSTQAPQAPAAAMTDDAAQTGVDPRGPMTGIEVPRYQIRALHSAARVLAHRGDSDGCEYIVAKMNEVYDGYSQQLQDAGVDPSAVAGWRQEQLALAAPLSEQGDLNYRVDDLTGTDVRNPQDENLGSVSDVVIDPESGSVSHILVARGGFLGIGEEHYAIPLDAVSVTQGFETLVVNVSESQIEAAPNVDPARFRDAQTMADERRGTDEYWAQNQQR